MASLSVFIFDLVYKMTFKKIGNTALHLIKSEKINPYKDTIPIFIKLESQNPTKSIKDRMVYYVVSKSHQRPLSL